MEHFHLHFPKEGREEIAIPYAPKKSSLPEGHYAFLEAFCANRECDCKEVLIQIEPQATDEPDYFEYSAIPTAVLKYSWEKPFSERNPRIYSQVPNSSLAPAALEFFCDYVQTHPDYAHSLSKHYAMIKKVGERWTFSDVDVEVERPAVSRPIQREPRIGRNELCSCGSGKKFKKCCLNTELSQDG